MRITRRVVDDSTLAINAAMDNNSSHQNGDGGGGPGPSGMGSNLNSSSNNTGGMNNKQMADNQGNSGGGGGGHQYTMPGVLHYIQHEFSRLEMERSQWDIDRAELQVLF